MTQRPKLREIFAADFRDHVVHHLLVDHLEQYWERVFIHDSYACRRGKGVHAAVERLQGFIRQVTANGQRRAWYLQLDVRNDFMSIDTAILWRLLEARLVDPDARWLTELLVFHDCTEGHVYTGRPGELERVPPHKTLLQAPPGKGLPIGNLNSQFFANVYLNGLDQFVKHKLKCRHYLRYCDDFVLLATDPEQLRDWRARIASYLHEALALELNPRERLRPVADGVNFLGYIVRRALSAGAPARGKQSEDAARRRSRPAHHRTARPDGLSLRSGGYRAAARDPGILSWALQARQQRPPVGGDPEAA